MRAATTWPGLTAVILAGGGGTRVGGRDKPMLAVAGVPMLDRVLAALAGADLRIVVGPARGGLPAGVRTVREEPPGAGPAAATAAALDLIPQPSPPRSEPQSKRPSEQPSKLSEPSGPSKRSEPEPSGPSKRSEPEPSGPSKPQSKLPEPSGPSGPESKRSELRSELPSGPSGPSSSAGGEDGGEVGELVGVFAADLPYLTAEAVAVLVDAVGGGVDGAVFVDERGKRQLLCGVWRAGALRAGVGRLGGPVGKSMRAVFEGLVVAEVRWEREGPAPYFDCDTEEDLRQAERQGE